MPTGCLEGALCIWLWSGVSSCRINQWRWDLLAFQIWWNEINKRECANLEDKVWRQTHMYLVPHHTAHSARRHSRVWGSAAPWVTVLSASHCHTSPWTQGSCRNRSCWFPTGWAEYCLVLSYAFFLIMQRCTVLITLSYSLMHLQEFYGFMLLNEPLFTVVIYTHINVSPVTSFL